MFLLHSEGPELGKYHKRDIAGFGNYTRITALPWNFITLSCILACNGKEVSVLPVCKGVVYGWRADQTQPMHIADIILSNSSIWSSTFWD